MAAMGQFYTSFEQCRSRKYSDAASTWDKGVAYVVGSIEGTEIGGRPTSDGMMLYNLANKRCTEWNTCQIGKAQKSRFIEGYHLAFDLGLDGALLRRCSDIKSAADKLATSLL